MEKENVENEEIRIHSLDDILESSKGAIAVYSDTCSQSHRGQDGTIDYLKKQERVLVTDSAGFKAIGKMIEDNSAIKESIISQYDKVLLFPGCYCCDGLARLSEASTSDKDRGVKELAESIFLENNVMSYIGTKDMRNIRIEQMKEPHVRFPGPKWDYMPRNHFEHSPSELCKK